MQAAAPPRMCPPRRFRTTTRIVSYSLWWNLVPSQYSYHHSSSLAISYHNYPPSSHLSHPRRGSDLALAPSVEVVPCFLCAGLLSLSFLCCHRRSAALCQETRLVGCSALAISFVDHFQASAFPQHHRSLTLWPCQRLAGEHCCPVGT